MSTAENVEEASLTNNVLFASIFELVNVSKYMEQTTSTDKQHFQNSFFVDALRVDTVHKVAKVM